MAWRVLTSEELHVLDGLDRAKQFIERQCQIPNKSPQVIEVSLDDYNLKTERIVTLEAELQRDRQWEAKLEKALQSIANLWPIDTTAKIGNVAGINDGRARAIIAEGAVSIARKALGIEKMP